MDPVKIRQAEELFHELANLPLDRRCGPLVERCRGDEELRSFVLALLANDAGGMSTFLRTPLGGFERTAVPGLASSTPERIGRYTVVRKLGEGGMSIVYEAQQDHPHRTVALKVIRPSIASEPLLRRLRFEAELLGRLQHPGIASVHDAGVADVLAPGQPKGEQPYIAMELIHGRPLTEFAAAESLSVAARLQLFMKVCEAVQYAHTRGVVHRDLKPSNILVDAHQQPKVLDFGVARLTDSDVQSTTMHTEIGQWIGTVPYMSPEQVGGDSREVDFRADIYALGVILYELLTNRLPYNLAGRSLPEAARIIRDEEPTRLGSVHARLRGDLETIVAKALEKDKARRFASVADLAADIRRHLHNEPITARPPNALYQIRKFAVRHKALSSSLAVLLVLLSAFGTWMTLLYGQADRLRRDATLEAERARQTKMFLETMLSSIDPEVAKGKDTTILRGILAEAAERVGIELASQPEIEADIRATIGTAYWSVGLTQDAQSQLESALTLRRQWLGKEHDSVAATMRMLAQCAAELGDRTHAEELAREALALRRKQFPSGDLRVAEALQTLGWMVSELGGNRTEADSLLRESLAMIERLGGRKQRLYADGLHSLTVVLWRERKLVEAESAGRETLALKSGLLGTDHPSTARAMDLLGQILASKGDFQAAEPLLRESVELHLRLFGEAHHAYAGALNSLASLLEAQAQYTAAEPLLRRTLELLIKVRGEDSHETAMAWLNLAALLDKKGDVSEARRLYRVADERFRRIFPVYHPYVYAPLTRLAESLGKTGEHDAAEPLWRQLVVETRQAFPSGHERHGIAIAKLCGLAHCMLELRTCSDAEEAVVECYEERNAVLGAAHQETLKALDDLVSYYGECGPPEKLDEVRRILDSARNDAAGDDGPVHNAR